MRTSKAISIFVSVVVARTPCLKNATANCLICGKRSTSGDFVLNLPKGITKPDKTLEQCVVTPPLLACLDDPLGFIRSAANSMSSKTCYLHGSFGAGNGAAT